MAEQQSPGRPSAVIYDLGYRPYTGKRESEWAVCAALFATGYKHVWGLGRGGKAKVLPFSMAGIVLLPSLILVTVYVLTGLNRRLIDYSAYASFVWLPVVVFLGAQAPVLFSRDIRSRAITLFFARPLRPVSYALARFLSLFAAMTTLLVVPLIVLWLGAFLAELPVGAETNQMAKAVLGALLYVAVLSCVGAVLASLVSRRGLGAVLIIGFLIVLNGFVTTVVALASSGVQDQEALAQAAGMLDPLLLAGGIEAKFLDGRQPLIAPPDSLAMGAAYVTMWVAQVVAMGLFLVARYRKVARG